MSAVRVQQVPDGYRPCVGLALFNRQGLVFIGRRANKKLREHVAEGHEWQMPQGGIDKGEEPLQAALRELQEECDVTSATLLAEAPGWLTYDLPLDVATQSWKGRYRGQAQKWFAFRFDGKETEINVLAPSGGHRPEFDAWRWESLARTPELIIPFKQQVYREVVRSFGHLAEK